MTLVPYCPQCDTVLEGGLAAEPSQWSLDGEPVAWRLLCPCCRAPHGVRLADGMIELGLGEDPLIQDLRAAFAEPVVPDPGPGVPSTES